MEFYRTFACSLDLIDGVWNLRISDICFIGCIVEEDGIIAQCKVHPFAKFLFRKHRTCRVVGVAQVDHVYAAVRNLWHEVVFCRAWEIGDIRPFAILEDSCASNHRVGVDINGIDRICHADVVVPAQDFLDVSGVALGTVVDEDLIEIDVDSSWQEIVFLNSFTQEVVTSLRSIAMEGSLVGHFLHRFVHGFDDHRSQRTRYVANTQTDHLDLRMRHLESVDPFSYVGKQVVAG